MNKLLRRISRMHFLLGTLMGIVVTLAVLGIIILITSPSKPLSNEQKGITVSWLPTTVVRWKDTINEMALRYDVDPNLIAILMTLESGGYSKAESEAGAKGLMQITAPTAKDIASKFLKNPVDSYDLFDPKTNIEFGAAYIAYLRNEFGTSKQAPSWDTTVELVAAGYNGGPGAANNVEQGKGLEDTQTVVYSRDAFNMWRERNVAKSPTYSRWLERGGDKLVEQASKEQ